ncbi:hypothetical protein ACF0H5_021784 [Mactra antiquata]
MLSIILISVCIGLGSAQTLTLPHGHELQQIIDHGFDRIDTDGDGVLSPAEVSSVASSEDADGDGHITLQEFINFNNRSDEIATKIFHAYDTDGDGFLPTDHMTVYLHLLDHNDNGIVTKLEFEHFQTKFLQCLFSEHGHTGSHGHFETCLHQY